ncbi:MAG: CHC2 zinc finger domain-containing protein [Chloroflexi bacterium]|nr:CHC2 zinc finger domain-containing protein [Chloroflexota bacterium]
MVDESRARLDLAALKLNNPLVCLLEGSGVRLRRVGPGKWQGLCPFHEDRHPSLLVDEQDQHFHCFGCGAHGDAIDFVMRQEGVGFLEACSRLARSSTPVGGRSDFPTERKRDWERLSLDEQVVMDTAAALYQSNLWHEQQALEYLRGRRIAGRVVRACGLGYADGHSLAAYLRRTGGLEIAQELGLLAKSNLTKSEGAPRELLAGRIVVPEVRGGHTAWFIGRRLTDDDKAPKYLALSGRRPMLGQDRTIGQKEVFLCEGIFDYLTAVGWGLPAFSPCGTHLPSGRLQFLAHAKTIYGLFDGDKAGREADARFALAFGERWQTVPLPEGCDLNDLGQRPGGAAEFFGLLAQARGAGEGSGEGG